MSHAIGLRYQTPRSRQGRKIGPEKPVFIYPGSLDRRAGRYVVHVQPGEVGNARSPTAEEADKLNLAPTDCVIDVHGLDTDQEVYIASVVEFRVVHTPDTR